MTGFVTVFNFVDDKSWHLLLAIGIVILCFIIALSMTLLMVFFTKRKNITLEKRFTKWLIIGGVLLFYVFIPIKSFAKIASEYLKFYIAYENSEYEIL